MKIDSLIVATARPAVETVGLPAGTSVVPKPYHDEAIVQKIAEIPVPARASASIDGEAVP